MFPFAICIFIYILMYVHTEITYERSSKATITSSTHEPEENPEPVSRSLSENLVNVLSIGVLGEIYVHTYVQTYVTVVTLNKMYRSGFA